VCGVTFQPVQQAGRVQGFDSAQHRLTLTEVRRCILEQTSVFRPEDLIPVPCHPDALAMDYAFKLGSKFVPLTGMIPPEVLIDGSRNTIVYEQEADLRNHLFKLFATNHSPASQASTLRELLCCLPKVIIPKDPGYKNLFRILIVQFIDAEAFDVRSVKKSCIHIAHPDGKRLIPFDTFNMFYRGQLESTRLSGLRGMGCGPRLKGMHWNSVHMHPAAGYRVAII
jgi:7,8-dihydro-6-hydroxymethylpterin dimethyltransferase